MGKPKKSSRAGVGLRDEISRKDEPMTDTVMQVLARRIRAAKKKMQKVTAIESLQEQGQDLQDEQDRLCKTKQPLTAVIEELTKLEPLVEAALMNELADCKQKVQEELLPTKEKELETKSHSLTESLLTEATDEGTSQEVKNSEEKMELMKTSTEEVEDESEDEEPYQKMDVDLQVLEFVIEVLYLSQILGKDRFDASVVLKEGPKNDAEESISTDDLHCLIEFGKKTFPSNISTPKDTIQLAKNTALELVSKESPEINKVCKIVEKLKLTDFYTAELKMAMPEFSVAVDNEAGESHEQESDDHKEKMSKPQQQQAQVEMEEAKSFDDGLNTQQSFSESGPTVPVSIFPSIPLPQYTPHQATGTDGSSTKAPRPFLPFPGVAMTTNPSCGLVMPQPPHIISLHPYFSVGRMPGPYIQPPPAPYYAAPPPPHVPSGDSSNPMPTVQVPANLPGDIIEEETAEEMEEEGKMETGAIAEMKAPTQAEKKDEEEEHKEKAAAATTMTTEATAVEVREPGQEKNMQQASKPYPGVTYAEPGAKVFTPARQGPLQDQAPVNSGDHRPTPWRGRGRYPRGRDYGPRSGRGSGYQHNSGPYGSGGRRGGGGSGGNNPNDYHRPTHRPPFMQPRDPGSRGGGGGGRGRGSYESRDRHRHSG